MKHQKPRVRPIFLALPLLNMALIHCGIYRSCYEIIKHWWPDNASIFVVARFAGFQCLSKLVRSVAKCTAFIIYQDWGEIST